MSRCPRVSGKIRSAKFSPKNNFYDLRQLCTLSSRHAARLASRESIDNATATLANAGHRLCWLIDEGETAVIGGGSSNFWTMEPRREQTAGQSVWEAGQV